MDVYVGAFREDARVFFGVLARCNDLLAVGTHVSFARFPYRAKDEGRDIVVGEEDTRVDVSQEGAVFRFIYVQDRRSLFIRFVVAVFRAPDSGQPRLFYFLATYANRRVAKHSVDSRDHVPSIACSVPSVRPFDRGEAKGEFPFVVRGANGVLR